MSNFDLIIFDYDGTLFHTQPVIVNCIRRTFEFYKLDIPGTDSIRRTIESGVTLTRTFTELNNDLHNDNIVSDMTATYRSFYQSESDLYIAF